MRVLNPCGAVVLLSLSLFALLPGLQPVKRSPDPSPTDRSATRPPDGSSDLVWLSGPRLTRAREDALASFISDQRKRPRIEAPPRRPFRRPDCYRCDRAAAARFLGEATRFGCAVARAVQTPGPTSPRPRLGLSVIYDNGRPTQNLNVTVNGQVGRNGRMTCQTVNGRNRLTVERGDDGASHPPIGSRGP